MTEELENAKEYIYLEYFIIAAGEMWDRILDILTAKAAEGLDVRVIYDDLGSLTTLPPGYSEYLRSRGIRCVAFNPMRFFLSGTLNNRDHRKIMIIDGKTAFSGGINLSDEYINRVIKHGHWKDGGFILKGPAVQNYERMFIEFWNAFSYDPLPSRNRIQVQTAYGVAYNTASGKASDGYVMPYGDSPENGCAVSNNLYMEMLEQAGQYAWFYTPYLMLGDTLLDTFARTARRGVDIRIIVPGVPDKKIAYRITQSFYRPLLEAGVHIYTYTPGFVHAKAGLIDDDIGVIGTVNLDYRSLFLHFECNALFYRASLLSDLKADFLRTQAKCREVKLSGCRDRLCSRITDSVLRIIAPLC